MRPGNDFNKVVVFALGCAIIVAVCWACGSPAPAAKSKYQVCGDVSAVRDGQVQTAHKVVARRERCLLARKIAAGFIAGGGKRLSGDSEGNDRVRIRGYTCKPSEEFVFCHRGKRRVIRWGYYDDPSSAG